VKDQYHAIGPDLYLPPAKALQMKRITMTCCAFLAVIGLCAQDTFSIAAVDTLTGEVGRSHLKIILRAAPGPFPAIHRCSTLT
jgi:hypothetical protein